MNIGAGKLYNWQKSFVVTDSPRCRKTP